MSEQQIPAGWYPDPVDTHSDPRPERWWDGKGWTSSTRPAPAPGAPTSDAPPAGGPAEDTAVLEGTVLDASGQAVHYPPLPPYTEPFAVPKPRPRPSKPVLIAASVAAVLGLAIGSGVTYLAMDGHDSKSSAAPSSNERRFGGGGGSNGGGSNGSNGSNGLPGDGLPGFGGGNGQGGGSGGSGGNGNGKGSSANLAVDMVNGVSLPILSGWEGGTTQDGYAAASIGKYTCPDGSEQCTLAGANTSRISGTDAKQAAQSDIEAAAKEAYVDMTGHKEIKSEAVTVAGRSGYLVRWQVDVSKGNAGYVETVVFPTADNKALIAVHMGFDIADKAPSADQMDAIVKGIATFSGGSGGRGTTTT
ncbi:DUF2510 domain-containing protein [Streptomyces sp. TLI_171]|uniref:DUF2510 domain-containing protein n=1 Tax=Streptomyces sp. TLI_171 TaxID=1938859 RepID=UPI000C195154|nr:DUF2510 domain-containing protein [Streptomyces sp. TLI_171]RKE22832.1 uncharacterized protein DUF2510 [Streptomyces sp. TLI_171]